MQYVETNQILARWELNGLAIYYFKCSKYNKKLRTQMENCFLDGKLEMSSRLGVDTEKTRKSFKQQSGWLTGEMPSGNFG